MERLRQAIIGVLFGLVVLSAIAFIFVGTVYVAAIVAPVMGLLYTGFRIARARHYWRSRGRFPLPNEGMRIIGVGRARWLAALEVLSGLAGIVLSLCVPIVVVGHASWAIPTAFLGLALHAGAGAARRRVLADANPVDILPPE